MTQRKRGKMMKRIISVILVALTIAVVIAGCITNNNNQTGSTTTTGTTTTAKPDGTTTTQAPVTTEKTDEPIEKPTASEAMAAYLKNLLRKNSGKEIADIIGKLDTSPYFGDLSTEMEISPYPEGYAPFIRGFEYGTEFPEYVKSGTIYYIFGDMPFAVTISELKDDSDKAAFAEFLSEKSTFNIDAEKPTTMKATGCEGNYAFIVLCTDELKTDIDPEREETVVSIMKKLRTAAGLSMGVQKESTSDERSKYWFGIEKNAALLETDGAVCEPMIGGGFSFVMVKVKDERDAKTIAAEMEKGLDPGKWICMRAENVSVKACGKYVVGVMGKTEECEKIIAAFENIMNAN